MTGSRHTAESPPEALPDPLDAALSPTFSGQDARVALTVRWGLPNAAPRSGDGLFGRYCRVLFVDDDRSGWPVAYWVPELPPAEIRRRLKGKKEP